MHGCTGQRVRESGNPIEAHESVQLSGKQLTDAQPELAQPGHDHRRLGCVIHGQEGHGAPAAVVHGAPAAGVADLHGAVHRHG